MFPGHVWAYVSRYVSQCWALDERGLMEVCIGYVSRYVSRYVSGYVSEGSNMQSCMNS